MCEERAKCGGGGGDGDDDTDSVCVCVWVLHGVSSYSLSASFRLLPSVQDAEQQFSKNRRRMRDRQRERYRDQLWKHLKI